MSLDFLSQYIQEINDGLTAIMADIKEKDQSQTCIAEGMEYALMAGGKRLRPVFCLMGAELAGLNRNQVLPFALGLEFLHTYSLVHDDLPAMDDDALRRGKPTCHIKFGEGEAVLIGDALMTHGMGLLLTPLQGISPSKQLRAAAYVVEAIGLFGMIGGQAADLLAEQGKKVDSEGLRFIHHHKTGKLLEASLSSGALLGEREEEKGKQLKDFGEKFGLAFQITDDLLDLMSTREELGKPIGSDEKNNKLTYPALYGIDESRKMAYQVIQECLGISEELGRIGKNMASLAEYVLTRKK